MDQNTKTPTKLLSLRMVITAVLAVLSNVIVAAVCVAIFHFKTTNEVYNPNANASLGEGFALIALLLACIVLASVLAAFLVYSLRHEKLPFLLAIFGFVTGYLYLSSLLAITTAFGLGRLLVPSYLIAAVAGYLSVLVIAQLARRQNKSVLVYLIAAFFIQLLIFYRLIPGLLAERVYQQKSQTYLTQPIQTKT